jgi:hypothetical protein
MYKKTSPCKMTGKRGLSHKYDSSRQACTKKQKKYVETYKKADPITEHEKPIVPLLIQGIFYKCI